MLTCSLGRYCWKSMFLPTPTSEATPALFLLRLADSLVNRLVSGSAKTGLARFRA